MEKERQALNRPNLARGKPLKRVLLPHWMALILTPVVFLLAHVAVPQELSRLAARHGWTHGRPGWLNLLGLILIGGGWAGLVWCLRLHFVASGGSFEMEHTPEHLVVHGPTSSRAIPCTSAAWSSGWAGSSFTGASRSWSALWSAGGMWLFWWCRGRSANWRRDLARRICATSTASHGGWARGAADGRGFQLHPSASPPNRLIISWNKKSLVLALPHVRDRHSGASTS